ncbi:uncharacterized protein LOC111548550 [Piliocolobus tephrosceles]|uniref:uncharacterized protein LOC111548550 n=1 Tax=Piliocolobus tephrosceles TaxID=591936 RepID=UPI000E6B2EE4|nr:uncharacterized protein LOC111548550 [Piliocolobus tephrosceles]
MCLLLVQKFPKVGDLLEKHITAGCRGGWPGSSCATMLWILQPLSSRTHTCSSHRLSLWPIHVSYTSARPAESIHSRAWSKWDDSARAGQAVSAQWACENRMAIHRVGGYGDPLNKANLDSASALSRCRGQWAAHGVVAVVPQEDQAASWWQKLISMGPEAYSGFGFVFLACRALAGMTTQFLTDVLPYHHRISHNTTLDQARYKSERGRQRGCDRKLHWFHHRLHTPNCHPDRTSAWPHKGTANAPVGLEAVLWDAVYIQNLISVYGAASPVAGVLAPGMCRRCSPG